MISGSILGLSLKLTLNIYIPKTIFDKCYIQSCCNIQYNHYAKYLLPLLTLFAIYCFHDVNLLTVNSEFYANVLVS